MLKKIRILIHVAILTTVCQCTTFNVIHAPHNGLQDHLLNHRQDNKMGIRFEGDSTVHMLDNFNTPDSLIHSGSIPTTSSKYQYVIVDHQNNVLESEPFYRTLTSSSPTTYEFYGRPVTQIQTQHLPAIPFASDYQYKVGLDRNQVHPNNEIPTWHIQVPDPTVLHAHVLEDIGVTGNMTRISAHNIDQFSNVRLELSGHTSRLFKKLTYSLRLDDPSSSSLNGYRRFKLRSCATDPSYMREKLYYDVLESMQLPSAKASYIRLFINQEPQGLYLVVDHYKHPFFRNVFGSGDVKYKTGALVQGSMQENPLAMGQQVKEGASLAYFGDLPENYVESDGVSVYKVEEGGKNTMKDVVSFIKFVHEMNMPMTLQKEEKKRVHEWNKRFDVNLFLKHLALELILGHGDGYMGAAHNYMLYQDLDQKGRFVWIASDLDQTMGNTLKATQYRVHATSVVDEFDRYGTFFNVTKRPLVESLMRVDTFRNQFQQLLLSIRRSLLHSDNITHYILYLKDLIERDVQWDQQLEPFRTDNFVQNKTLYETILYEKVVQLPLGRDFITRIDNRLIDFNTAIQGDIEDHPSITSLFSWFRNLSN